MKAYFAISLVLSSLAGCAAMTDGLKAVNSGGRQLLSTVDSMADSLPKGRLKAADFGDAPIVNLGFGVKADLPIYKAIGDYYAKRGWEAGNYRYEGLTVRDGVSDVDMYNILDIESFANFDGAPVFGDAGATTRARANSIHPPTAPQHLRISNYVVPGVVNGAAGWCATAQFEYKAVPKILTNLQPNMTVQVKTSHVSHILIDKNGRFTVSRLDRNTGAQTTSLAKTVSVDWSNFNGSQGTILTSKGCVPIQPGMFVSQFEFEKVNRPGN